MKGRFFRAALALIVVSACAAAEAATTAEERGRIWALARLVLQPGSEEGLATIRSGILDASPAVRAAAARVSRTTRAKAATVELREALARESDLSTTLEILSALADLDGTSSSDDVLIASVKAADTTERLQALVAARGVRLTAMWPQIKGILEEKSRTVVRGLAEGLHRSGGNVFAIYALRDSMEELYDALLFAPGLNIEPGAVIAGLASNAAGIRSSAYIAVADRNLAVNADLPTVDQPTLCERASRHLFEAARGVSRTDSLRSLMAALASDPKARECVLKRFSGARDSVRGLTPDERAILLKGVAADKDTVNVAVRKVFESSTVRSPPPSEARRSTRVQTLSDHLPDFVQSVLEGTKCKGRERFFDGVEITYAEGGRIRSIQALKAAASAEGCGEVAKILGLTSYATDGYEQVAKILPERPEFLACLIEADPPQPSADVPPGVARPRGTIKEPKKLKSEPPQYPVNPSLGNTQGIVIVEAHIRRSGCVGGLTLLKSVHPILDLEAINAVSGWRYTPTLLDGVAVPVIMTVTVNFRRD